MLKTFLQLLTLLVLLASNTLAFSHTNIHIQPNAIVCPNDGQSRQLPSFSEARCVSQSFYSINPRDSQLWVKATIEIPETILNKAEPLGIYISGKASSVIYLNGELVGQNGQPSNIAREEIVGKMDAVVHAPKHLLKQGQNEIVLLISGHHGFLNLANPMHDLSIAQYTNPTHLALNRYWRSFLPLGVLLLGAIYFGVLAFQKTPLGSSIYLPLMCLISAIQLCVEVSRGLFAYSYPFHDLRLIIILFCSFGFGLCLFAYVLSKLKIQHKNKWLPAAILSTLIPIVITQGFDYKSAFALGIPFIFALTAAVIKAFAKQPGAIVMAIGIALSIITVIAAPSAFLDMYFFYLIAALILLFFSQHSRALAHEQEKKRIEKNRADKLQMIVDQNRLNTDSPTLAVKSAGKTDLITISSLVYCKGAGDYVELVLNTGDHILHSDNLSELEQSLPSTFIRVHRSYIVNTSKIASIERKTSGTGLLSLTNGDTIPVSRRIMPSVQQKMALV